MSILKSSKCVSQGETSSVYCICLSAWLSVCNCPVWLSLPVGPEGTPALKEATLPFNNSFCQRDGVRERGRPQSHQLQNSLIVTDAINRNLHYSQHDQLGASFFRIMKENCSSCKFGKRLKRPNGVLSNLYVVTSF